MLPSWDKCIWEFQGISVVSRVIPLFWTSPKHSHDNKACEIWTIWFIIIILSNWPHDVFLGLYSLSGKTYYRKISWSLDAASFGFKLSQSLWFLAGTSAVLLPRCLSNFRAIRPLQHPISRLRDFTRFGGKTSYRFVNRCPDSNSGWKLWTHWRPTPPIRICPLYKMMLQFISSLIKLQMRRNKNKK